MTAASFSASLQTIVPSVAVVSAPLAMVQAPAGSALTLAELIDAYMANYAGRDKSMGWRVQVWRERLGARRLVDITSSEIRDALRALAAEPARVWRGIDADGKPIHKALRPRKSAGTVNRYHALLSGLLQWAIDEGHVPEGWPNPARGIKRGRENPGVVRFLDAGERTRLLQACRDAAWPRLYGLVLLALTSGGRRGELLGLRWRDVDFDQAVAYLRRTKNGTERTLVLVPAVIEQLQSYRRGRLDDYVFCSVRDPKRPYAMAQLWAATVKRAQVERFRFHDLRHSFASALAQEGASLVELADAMGHRSMAMVQRYAHLSAQSRARLVNRVMGNVR